MHSIILLALLAAPQTVAKFEYCRELRRGVRVCSNINDRWAGIEAAISATNLAVIASGRPAKIWVELADDWQLTGLPLRIGFAEELPGDWYKGLHHWDKDNVIEIKEGAGWRATLGHELLHWLEHKAWGLKTTSKHLTVGVWRRWCRKYKCNDETKTIEGRIDALLVR